MTLPVINVPTYSVTIPSVKDKITFRPFLVKEEKILLLALEEGGDDSIARAIKQIINNCTFEKVEVESLATFDLELIFLKIIDPLFKSKSGLFLFEPIEFTTSMMGKILCAPDKPCPIPTFKVARDLIGWYANIIAARKEKKLFISRVPLLTIFAE